jgi:acyl dehydratase
MAEQVYYEDIEPGTELEPIVKLPTTVQLVRFAGASGDFYPIHYDKDFAQASGLPGVIVHGWLALSFLWQLVSDWMGDEGNIVRFGGSYRGMNPAGEEIFGYGRVTKKYVEGDRNCVRLEIWAENPKGERTVSGSVVVALPSRA